MKNFLAVLFLLVALTVTGQNQYFGKFNGNGAALTNLISVNAGLAQPMQYLRVVPITEFNAPSIPSFGFKVSPDGTNFNWLITQTSFLDSVGYGCFAPSLVYFNGNYVVTTDSGANIGHSNEFTITSSSNLVNWSSALHIANNVSGGEIYGQSWFTEPTTGQPYLYYGVRAIGGNGGTNIYVTYPIDTNDMPFTNFSAPQIVAGTAGHLIWDPSVIKIGSTYFMAFADTGLRQVHLWTNTVSPTSTFFKWQDNILPNGVPGVEGMNFCFLTNGIIRLYEMATTPNNIGKTYFQDSTDMVSWTAPVEITEQAPVSDHGTTISVTNYQQQASIGIISSQAVTKSLPFYQSWDITGTNGVATSPLLFATGNSICLVNYKVTGIELQQYSTVNNETHPFLLEVSIPIFASSGVGDTQPYGSPSVKSIKRVANEFGFSAVYTNGGVGLQLFSGNNFPVVRYHIQAQMDSIAPFLQSDTPAAITIDNTTGAQFPYNDEGMITGDTNGLAAIFSHITIAHLADGTTPPFGPPNPLMELTNGSVVLYASSAPSAGFLSGTAALAGVGFWSSNGVPYVRTSANGSTYIDTPLITPSVNIGSLTLTNAPTLQATNAGAGITVGVTAVKLFFSITNNGTVYRIPAY